MVAVLLAMTVLISACGKTTDDELPETTEKAFLKITEGTEKQITTSESENSVSESHSATVVTENTIELNSEDTEQFSSNDSEINGNSQLDSCDEVIRVATALKAEDRDSLSDEKDIYVYDAVKQIIDKIITEDMSQYDKELAVHDYIVSRVQYDPDGIDEFSTPSEESYYPYGVLKNKKSVCLGYARTFQLFMDVLDIECITVHAYANNGEEHGWNMVNLDGDWYQVDVTWDDPVPDQGSKVSHKFFNVTDIMMKITFHQWDNESFPECTSNKYAYKVNK